MNFKPSELLFKFPIRLYDPTVSGESANNFESLYGKKPKPAFIAGHARVFIDDILSWCETFPRHRSLDKVVEMGGPDCTQVTMKNGDEYFCDWRMDQFEEEYDAKIQWLEDTQKRVAEEDENDFEVVSLESLITEENYKDFEKYIKEFKKQLKLKQPSEQKSTVS